MAGTIGPSPLRRTWYKFYVGLHWRENSYAPKSMGGVYLRYARYHDRHSSIHRLKHISHCSSYILLCFGLVRSGEKQHMM